MPAASRDSAIDAVKATYEPKIRALLRAAGDVLANEAGMIVSGDIDDISDTEHSWNLVAERGNGKFVDLTITIAEALAREGEGADEFGIAFVFSAVADAGMVYVDWCPYNFTERIWVDARDAGAVDERFALFESIDISELPEAVRA